MSNFSGIKKVITNQHLSNNYKTITKTFNKLNIRGDPFKVRKSLFQKTPNVFKDIIFT